MISGEKSGESFLREAREFHRTAVNGRASRPEIFTNEIVFNMLGMVIEKYIMAFLINNGTLADNHTFNDLADSTNRIRPLPPELEALLRRLDGVQNLCPVIAQDVPPDYSDQNLEAIMRAADEVLLYTGL